MKAIGGYFELALREGFHYHSDALLLNTARNCFEYILRSRGYKKVYIPFYTCDAILEPLKKCHVEWEFYHVNQYLEPVRFYQLFDKEAFLYTNYFGLKQDCVRRMSEHYGSKLIIDNSQSFFATRINNIDTFYSARKFFGVSDGAYLYTEQYLSEEFAIDVSCERMNYLSKRLECGAEAAYSDFHLAEESLCDSSIKRMSKLSETILCSLDYEQIKKRRCSNYQLLDRTLRGSNGLSLELLSDNVPMSYPYFTDDKLLRDKLIKNKIFIATYWPNVRELCIPTDLEYQFTDRILALPIDQRYGCDEMNIILKMINS